MTWRDNIRDGRVLRAEFGLHIEGCGTTFVGTTPVGPDGAAWSAPKPEGITPDLYFTIKEGLVVRTGIKQLATMWDPKAGVASGGGCTFSIVADEDVRELFAAEDPDIVQTLLAADVGYDDASTSYDRYKIQVDDASDFNDPAVTSEWEFGHIGAECFAYNSRTGAQFGDNTSANIVRGMWKWRSESRLSREHLCNEDTHRARLPVTAKQTNWYGRRVTLLAWLCDEQGYALDDGYRGDNEVEIWSGFISSVGPSSSNWQEYEIRCVDLTDRLRQDFGVDKVKGLAGVGVPFARVINADSPRNNEIAAIAVTIGAGQPATVWNTPILEDGTGSQVSGSYYLNTFLRHFAATVEATVNSALSDEGSTAEVAVSSHLAYWNDPESGTPTGGVRIAMSNTVWDSAFDVQVWPSFSLSLGAFGAEAATFGFYTNDTEYVAEYFRPLGDTVIGPDDLSILVYPDQDELDGWTEPDDAPGWAVLTQGDLEAEIISYTGVESAPEIHPTAITLTGVRRGRMGTPANSYGVDFTENDGADSTRTIVSPQVEFVQGFEGTSALTIAGQVLVSTGTDGAYHSTLDVLPRAWGLALDPACVDTALLADSDLHPPYCERDLVLASATTLEDFLSKQAIFSGFAVLPRTMSDGTFRLTAVPLDVPLAHLPVAASLEMGGDGGILHKPLPSLQLSSTDLVTSVEIQSRYNPATQEFSGSPFILTNANCILTHGKSKRLKLETPGVPSSSLVTSALAAAERIFWLYGRPWYDLVFETDARGLLLGPGDVVEGTVAGIPTPYSESTGLSAVLARVLNVAGSWFQPSQKGAVKVTARLFPVQTGLAPTFTVDSYTPGSPNTITVADNDWTNALDASPWEDETSCRDYHYGPESGVTYPVWIFNDGALASREAHTVTPTSTPGEYELDSALTLTVGSATRMEYADWDTVVAAQQAFAYIADDGGTLGSGGDSPKKWSP